MARAFWAQFYPINPATGLTVELFVTSFNNVNGTNLVTGKTYYPYLESFPVIEVSVFDGQFDGNSSLSVRDLELSANQPEVLAAFPYVWDGTACKLFIGDTDTVTSGGGIGQVTQIGEFVVNGSLSISDAKASVSLLDRSYLLERDLLSLSYAGTGGIEGPVGYTGVLKPLAIGYPLCCEPVLLEAPFLTYQYNAYGRSGGVQVLSENGLTFPAATNVVAWQGSIAATYTALKALTLTLGQWADAPSIGIFRLGGEPVSGGVIVVDVAGVLDGSLQVIKNTDAVIAYLVNTVLGIPYNTTSFTAFQTATSQEVCDYIVSQRTVESAVASYVRGAGGYYIFNNVGELCLGLVRIAGSSILTIRSDGTLAPMFEEAKSLPTSAPYKTIRLGGQQCFRVHSLEEISDALKQAVNTANTNASTALLNAQTFRQATPPSTAVEGNFWVDTDDGNLLMRHSGLGLFINGVELTINGARIDIPWVAVQDQKVIDGINAQASLTARVAEAERNINAISSDDILQKGEKAEINRQYNDINSEYANIVSKSQGLGVVTELATFTASYLALVAYIATLPTTWNDANFDTPIVGSTFRSSFSSYFTSRTALLAKNDEVAATKAVWSGVSGTGGQPSGADVAGTVKSGGGVADNKVSTPAVVANAVSGFTNIAAANPTFSNGFSGSVITYTMVKPTDTYLVRLTVTGTLLITGTGGTAVTNIGLFGRANNGVTIFGRHGVTEDVTGRSIYRQFIFVGVVPASSLPDGNLVDILAQLSVTGGGTYDVQFFHTNIIAEFYKR